MWNTKHIIISEYNQTYHRSRWPTSSSCCYVLDLLCVIRTVHEHIFKEKLWRSYHPKSNPYPSKRRAELGIIKVLLLTPHTSKYNLANFSRGLLYSGREGGGWALCCLQSEHQMSVMWHRMPNVVILKWMKWSNLGSPNQGTGHKNIFSPRIKVSTVSFYLNRRNKLACINFDIQWGSEYWANRCHLIFLCTCPVFKWLVYYIEQITCFDHLIINI